jgi:hypothetical protein
VIGGSVTAITYLIILTIAGYYFETLFFKEDYNQSLFVSELSNYTTTFNIDSTTAIPATQILSYYNGTQNYDILKVYTPVFMRFESDSFKAAFPMVPCETKFEANTEMKSQF